MNNENSKLSVFEEAMKALLAKVDSTEKFVLEQAPEVCRQLAREKMTCETMDAIVSGSFLVGSLTALYFAVSAASQTMDHHSDAAGWIFLSAIASLAVLISFICTYGSVQQLVRLKVAPKVFLLREFSKLVNPSNDE